MAGQEVGPLAGVPIGTKDLFFVKGVRTTFFTAADDFPCPNRLHSKRILPERRHHDFGPFDSAERGDHENCQFCQVLILVVTRYQLMIWLVISAAWSRGGHRRGERRAVGATQNRGSEMWVHCEPRFAVRPRRAAPPGRSSDRGMMVTSAQRAKSQGIKTRLCRNPEDENPKPKKCYRHRQK